MARGVIDGLESPFPVGLMLPALYQDDEFAQRLTSAFDEMLAPIFATLDCIDSYFDPWLTPPDFLAWLASWVGVELDQLVPDDRQRLLVSEAVRLYRARGTALGLAEHIAIYTGLEVEIEESGGSTWSAAPGGSAPGENAPRLLVRVISEQPDAVNVSRVDALVAMAKPAHVPHSVVVVAP